jgi:hypothetical protein
MDDGSRASILIQALGLVIVEKNLQISCFKQNSVVAVLATGEETGGFKASKPRFPQVIR